jgi:hypothetical protein
VSKQALLHALLFVAALGILHLGLSWRRPLPFVRFCAAAAGAHVVIGLGVWLPLLARQVLRSWTTAAWAPLLALGLFATGGVLGAAWIATVRGLERLVRRGAPAG